MPFPAYFDAYRECILNGEVNQGSNRCQFLGLWLDSTGVKTLDLPHSERTLYPLVHRGG